MDVYEQLAYNATRWTIGSALSVAMRLKAEGCENVPTEGGALLVANHRNPVLDPAAIAVKVERPIHFIAASVFASSQERCRSTSPSRGFETPAAVGAPLGPDLLTVS